MEPSTQHDPAEGLDYRRRYRGLIGVHSKVPIRDRAIFDIRLLWAEDPGRIY